MAVTITNLYVVAPTTAGGAGAVVFDVNTTTQAYSAALDAMAGGSGPAPATGVVVRGYAGTYQLTVNDLAFGSTPYTHTVTIPAYVAPVPGCTDPNANNYNPNATLDNGTCAYTLPVRHAHFRVPAAQSLRFVLPGNTTVPAFDNTLLADETPLDTTNPGYCQLVERGDTLVLQAQSNYTTGTPVLTVLPLAGGAAVLTLPLTRVVQGVGQTGTFAAYLRVEPTNQGRSRIYFNAGTLPLPFAPGDRVTIGGAGALNGTYPLLSVLEDAAAAVPYLVLGVAYPSAAQRIDCTVQSTYAVQSFDTWQVAVPFTAVVSGFYRARIAVADPDFGTAYALSEPIDVAATHPNTRLLAWRNFDNAFGLNYTAGLINRIRVLGRFFHRETATTRQVLRESSGRLLLLAGAAYRRVRLDVYLEPAWRHEVIAVATVHDFFTVDGLEVVAEDAYTTSPVPHFALSNGTVLLEQTDFLGAGNRDDVGDPLPGGTLLLANDTYLTVNP